MRMIKRVDGFNAILINGKIKTTKGKYLEVINTNGIDTVKLSHTKGRTVYNLFEVYATLMIGEIQDGFSYIALGDINDLSPSNIGKISHSKLKEISLSRGKYYRYGNYILNSYYRQIKTEVINNRLIVYTYRKDKVFKHDLYVSNITVDTNKFDMNSHLKTDIIPNNSLKEIRGYKGYYITNDGFLYHKVDDTFIPIEVSYRGNTYYADIYNKSVKLETLVLLAYAWDYHLEPITFKVKGFYNVSNLQFTKTKVYHTKFE